jgi:hypothetical protein
MTGCDAVFFIAVIMFQVITKHSRPDVPQNDVQTFHWWLDPYKMELPDTVFALVADFLGALGTSEGDVQPHACM